MSVRCLIFNCCDLTQDYFCKVIINYYSTYKQRSHHIGVVSYTLVANHIPVNAKIIGVNEHESHFVFDIFFNNTTDIQPQIHSTDTHGTNEINFAVLHSFGSQFAPRYKDILFVWI